MISYFTIANFRNRLNSLRKVKRDVYSGVENEITKEFSNKEMDTIRMNRDMILLENAFIVIKLRMQDKKNKLSKKDGFRLIYMALKNKDEVVFLDIYPKMVQASN